MCHLRHRLRIFLFDRKVMFIFLNTFLNIFYILRHPMIYQISDVMMSISTWKRVHFWIYLLNNNSLTHQNWSIDRYKQPQKFSKIFWMIWRIGVNFQAHFNLSTCSNYSITNFVKLPVFHFFKRVNQSIENGKYQQSCH